MNDYMLFDGGPGQGYRLHKLELYNWGTFDSIRGNVHTARPEGATTLLIGQNGSGKSTLVDALLTLLVRPVIRNYNVAAGARKQERNERTYIKGAYGRIGRDEDNRAEIQFLRPNSNQYSALLACFKNDLGDAFSIAQVLYLNSEGRAIKVYCFATEEKSIANDCANLNGTERVRQQLEQRGFRSTTVYNEYHNWFAKATGVRTKAMDMFNQTVAVKDVQSLNKFIREHMLESKPWNEKIESLQAHFTQLSEAHQSLVRVRRQHELLTPIEEKGCELMKEYERLRQMECVLAASDSFFRQKTVDIFEPQCVAAEANLTHLGREKERLDDEITALQEQERQITNEMETAGGERLKQIPLLMKTAKAQRDAKLKAHQRFHQVLQAAGIREPIGSQHSMANLQERLPELLGKIEKEIEFYSEQRDDKSLERAEASRQRENAQRELTSLEQHHGNLPEAFADVRRRMCEHLRLPESDLVFAAELISVKPEHHDWESSIEMVLRSFGLSLLVSQRNYPVVSRYIDRTRLTDGRGRGQRLVYLKVGERARIPHGREPIVRTDSLVRKLALKEGHPLLPWVRAELEERFNYKCCDTVEEFQQASGLALTRERHVKMRGGRHEKDDREHTSDRSRFILGWDNRSKRRHLAQEILRLDESIKSVGSEIARLDSTLDAQRARQTAIHRLKEISIYDEIDYLTHEQELSELQEEKESLEQNNDVLRVLKQRLKSIKDDSAATKRSRDEVIICETQVSSDLAKWKNAIHKARNTLLEREHAGELATHIQSFSECEAYFTETPLTPDTLTEQEQIYLENRRCERDTLKEAMQPHENEVCRLMNLYLREFSEEQADLDADLSYLESFCHRNERIRHDDLPRHEARFKERLNEKVIQEIGLLNGAFRTESTEINAKIDLLNQSLRQLEYRPGTYMQLDPRPVKDMEIADFQASLRECLAGTFEGTLEADEARYIRIEKLLKRLREETRWRDKVTDVRRWFDFAAREVDEATGTEQAYYEDSTGQSGGEKAKLAFTILVAAIAYQYDIDPSQPSSERFQFVVVDEMFSKVDDQYSEYALQLFRKFGLQLLIVAPLDAKARVTEPYVGCYLHVVKDMASHRSEIYSMTAKEFEESMKVPTAAVQSE